MGEVLLPRSSPPPPGPPLPRLPWHHSQSILTPPSSVPAAWAPASCVFLGMLQNSAETKEIPLEFAGRALTRQSTRAADLDSIPLQPEDYNFAGKEGVASELHLTRAIYLACFLGSRLSFSSCLGSRLSLGRRTSLGGYEFKRLRLHGFSLRLGTGSVKLSVMDPG